MKDVPKQVKEASQMLHRAAGKQQVYFTMDGYDFVAVDEVPNDEVMMKFLSSIGKRSD